MIKEDKTVVIILAILILLVAYAVSFFSRDIVLP